MLQHFTVERQVSDDPLQATVFLLQPTQMPHLDLQNPAYFFSQLQYVA